MWCLSIDDETTENWPAEREDQWQGCRRGIDQLGPALKPGSSSRLRPQRLQLRWWPHRGDGDDDDGGSRDERAAAVEAGYVGDDGGGSRRPKCSRSSTRCSTTRPTMRPMRTRMLLLPLPLLLEGTRGCWTGSTTWRGAVRLIAVAGSLAMAMSGGKTTMTTMMTTCERCCCGDGDGCGCCCFRRCCMPRRYRMLGWRLSCNGALSALVVTWTCFRGEMTSAVGLAMILGPYNPMLPFYLDYIIYNFILILTH